MQTTPAPAPTDPTAVMGRRIVAYLIDLAIGIALAVTLFLSVADSRTVSSEDRAQRICDIVQENEDNTACFNISDRVWVAEGGDIALILLVLLAYGVFFHFLLPGVAGYSIGKAIMGLRIVSSKTGQLAGLGANGVRWLLWVVDTQPCGVPLVGLITGLASKGHRRVGDMAAGTVVVDKSTVGQPLVIPGVTTDEVEPAAWTAPPVSPPPSSGAAGASPPTDAASTAPPTPPPSPPHSAVPTTPPAFPPPTTPPVDRAPPAPVEAPAAPDDSGDTDHEVGDGEHDDGEHDVGDDEHDAAAIESEPEPMPEELPPDPGPIPTADGPASTPSSESATPQPGVDAPQWDAARNTYIQWDPQLGQWMEWSESEGKWVPISS